LISKFGLRDQKYIFLSVEQENVEKKIDWRDKILFFVGMGVDVVVMGWVGDGLLWGVSL